MSRLFSRSIFVLAALSLVGLSGCTLFHRHNDQAANEGKVWSPLDNPQDAKAPDAKVADATPAPTAAADQSTAASPNAPTVTLMRKDGTPLKSDDQAMAKNTAAKDLPGSTAIAESAEKPKTWSYSGDTGPDYWSSVNSEYATCQSGQMQSPVDLKWHKPMKGGALSVNYHASKSFVSDNGHAIQVAFDSAGHIQYKGKVYDLMQAQFHSPSEHTLSGKQFPLEVQFLNKDAAGKWLVLSAFYKEGKANPILNKIWNAIPNPPAPASTTDLNLNTRNMLPPMKTYYEYKGSLTTPPCTEDVQWVVFNTPMNVSSEQLDALHHYHNNNSRPIQLRNGRHVINH